MRVEEVAGGNPPAVQSSSEEVVGDVEELPEEEVAEGGAGEVIRVEEAAAGSGVWTTTVPNCVGG